MSYVLGIDVGRTRGSAAVCPRVGTGYGPPVPVPLDGRPWVDSVLLLADDGSVLVGGEAAARAPVEPDRVARAVVDRVGDDVPILVAGEFHAAETLLAAVVAWIADAVADVHGGHPERVAVTHPPEWGGYRRGLLHQALHAAGVPGALLLPTVVAAAETRHDREPVPSGSSLAVAVVGGRAAELAVVQRGPAAFDLVSHTRIGAATGDTVDDLITRHVAERDPGALSAPDLRAACRAAKEHLATAPTTHIGPVPLTRAEYDDLLRPAANTLAAHLRAVARDIPDEVYAGAVLAGGAATAPLLAAIAADNGFPVDPDPATAVCRGAAIAARLRPSPNDSRPRATPVDPEPADRARSDRDGAVGRDRDGSGEFAGAGQETSARGAGHDRGVAAGRGSGLRDGLSDPRLDPVPRRSAPHDHHSGRGGTVVPPDPEGAPDQVGPPPRPPVDITPLIPPPRRFALPTRSPRAGRPDSDKDPR